MARIHHNLEDFNKKHCNSQFQYNMRPNDFSIDKLTQRHRCSWFCLPSSAHSLKNENKLSMEISCQLFWNKQYKLHNNYVWGTHISEELEAYQQEPKCPNYLGRCQGHQIHGDKHTLLKIIHLAKCFPTRATKIGYALRIVYIYLKIRTMMGP